MSFMIATIPNDASALTLFTHEDAVFLGGANASTVGQWPVFALGISSINNGSGGDAYTSNSFGNSSQQRQYLSSSKIQRQALAIEEA